MILIDTNIGKIGTKLKTIANEYTLVQNTLGSSYVDRCSKNKNLPLQCEQDSWGQTSDKIAEVCISSTISV